MKYLIQLYLILNCALVYGQDIKAGTIKLETGAMEGYTLVSPIFSDNTYLINNCGELIHQWSSDYNGFSSYLLEDGSLVRSASHDRNQFGRGGDTGRIEKIDWDGNLIWSYTLSTDSLLLHHDIEPLPNGNILAMVWERGSDADIALTGRADNLLDRGSLYFERIIEVKPIGSSDFEIVWEWNIKDHLIQDVDQSLSNYGEVDMHPEKMDANFTTGRRADADWLHYNSVDYNPNLDQIIISSRNTSEFYIIDHSTTTAEASSSEGGTYGKGGDFLFRWGNPEVYGRGDASDKKLFGQHDVHWLQHDNPDDNRIIIYNNGSGRTPEISSVDVITIPRSPDGYEQPANGSSYLPSELDYTFISSFGSELDFTSWRISGAQELENGNTLILDGEEGTIFEVDVDGSVVWIYQNPVNRNGPIPQNQSLEGLELFRALKYSPNYVAFDGRDLTPGEVLETNVVTLVCDLINSTEDPYFADTQLYPNPVSDFLNIKSPHNLNLELYNIQGKLLARQKVSGASKIYLTPFNSDILMLRLTDNSGKHHQTYKVIKM